MANVVVEMSLKCMAGQSYYTLFEELKNFFMIGTLWTDHMKSVLITVNHIYHLLQQFLCVLFNLLGHNLNYLTSGIVFHLSL